MQRKGDVYKRQLQAVCSAVGQLVEQLLLVFEVVVEVALADIYLVRDHLQ